MKILKQSTDEMRKSEIFGMTKDAKMHKMSEHVGLRIEIDKWLHYEDENAKGDKVEILSIKADDGEVYATNSATFKQQFFEILDMLEGEPVDAIEVVSGVSKNGREYITCSYVGDK